MTGVALGFFMLTSQQILGIPIMVEDDFFPVVFLVAGFAFVAVPTLVPLFLVILAVARYAGLLHLQFRVRTGDATLVTCIAFGIYMLVPQLVVCLVMIELGFLPVFLVMAGFALIPKFSSMPFFLFDFTVACDAFVR